MDPFVLCSTFNEDAANYDRWRPRYVPELFAAVLRYAGAPGKALEIGMGTGQATEPFLQAGWQVTGVERGERLAAFAREKFRCRPQLQVVQGDFLTCPLSGPFDLIYAATAFHWLPEDRAFPRVKELLLAVADLLRHCTVNQFEVWRNGELMTALPVLVLILLVVLAYWISLPLLVIGLLFGCRYRFSGPDLDKNKVGETVNRVSDSVRDAVGQVRDEFQREFGRSRRKKRK